VIFLSEINPHACSLGSCSSHQFRFDPTNDSNLITTLFFSKIFSINSFSSRSILDSISSLLSSNSLCFFASDSSSTFKFCMRFPVKKLNKLSSLTTFSKTGEINGKDRSTIFSHVFLLLIRICKSAYLNQYTIIIFY
jgi:hypothetical protein